MPIAKLPDNSTGGMLYGLALYEFTIIRKYAANIN